MIGLKSRLRTILVAAFSLNLFAAQAQTQNQTYTDIHDFGGRVVGPTGASQEDGLGSAGGVTFDSSGNMYGTTSTGALGEHGAVWELTSLGAYKVLHDFGQIVLNADGVLGLDGSSPQGRVTVDASGNIYGTAAAGGAYNLGMLWEITNAGTYLDLHDFGANIVHADGSVGGDGYASTVGVTLDPAGNIYGTTSHGGEGGGGIVWELTKAGVYKDLHDFGLTVLLSGGTSGTDGTEALGAVAFDGAGNMYGTTLLGGASNLGILWKLSNSGKYFDLHDFGGSITKGGTKIEDGWWPIGAVALDSSGNIYGTTYNGGSVTWGMVWRMSSSGTYTDLHDFGTPTVTRSNGLSAPDGDNPRGDVVLDSSGNLYGTTFEINYTLEGGVVWEVTKAGTYIDLHDFGFSGVSSVGGQDVEDGQLPTPGVTLDRYGNIYGTTEAGGLGGNGTAEEGRGTVWTIGSLHGLSLSTSAVPAGGKVIGTVTLGMPAPIGGTVVNLSCSDANAAPPATIEIPAGLSTATFTIETGRITTSDPVTITASQMNASFTAPLTIQPATIAGFSYFNGPKSGSTLTLDVDLTGPAPAGGLTVTVKSNSALAPVPASVFVPAGATSAPFTVTYGTVTSPTPVIITGTVGAVSQTATPTIKP